MTRSRRLQSLLLAGLAILLVRSIDFGSLLAEDAPPRIAANRKKAAPKQKPSKRATGKSVTRKGGEGVSPSAAQPRQEPARRKAAARVSPGDVEDPLKVAARVDELIAAELARGHVEVAPRTSDADFLRRVSLDITGTIPSPEEATLFALDSDPGKRSALVDRLLASPGYATNWARYWRDVIFIRATETRPFILAASQRAFEPWMAGKLRDNTRWDKIATELLTATGGASEDGQTALIFAQRAEPDEVAAETSRIFLGIQLQCANCHDHPSDGWKREQFHGLAAFFPRIQMRRKPESNMLQAFEIVSLSADGGRRFDFQRLTQNPEQFIRRFDGDGDKLVSRDELKGGPVGRLLDLGDVNKDGKLSADEIRKLPPPPMMDGRGSLEYHMPDLSDPQSEGTKFDPTFFLGNQKPGAGLGDIERRQHLAEYITSPENPWFAKALVNRIWAQLVGEGFYMPVDDIGPERTPSHPEALEALSNGFIASGYDLRWLFRAIANSETYQRQIRHLPPSDSPPHFASSAPIRLRADELFTSLVHVLGINEDAAGPRQQQMMMGPTRGDRSPRGQFTRLFGFDPSTPPDEVTGTLPQALFLMNGPQVNNLIRARGNTQLARILARAPEDGDAIKELYLLVHSREPSSREMQTCRDYVKEVGQRQEAFEDILWSLINSTEFQSKR